MDQTASPEDILEFWIDTAGPDRWYKSDPEFDAEIAEKFAATWAAAMEGRFALWLTYPSGALAYLILMDQMPRNMFRGTARAFSSDPVALAVAKRAIAQGYDLKIDGAARQFFYLPLMHSENLADQDRCVRLLCERMPDSDNLLHARVHREIIRKFGRFPFRNEALERRTTQSEESFVQSGGYAQTLAELSA